MQKAICGERLVRRRSRLHRGLAQVFLALFALLAILAPTLEAPLSGGEFEEYVSAPADPRSDAATIVSATPGEAEELEEEADQDEAIVFALATLRCPSDAEYQATDAWSSAFPRLSAHFCTGPPTL